MNNDDMPMVSVSNSANKNSLKIQLDIIYGQFNHRKYVHPDPLEFLYKYEDILQREIAGFIASSLAYGRVTQILKSVSAVLEKMKPDPVGFLNSATAKTIINSFKGFKHRFTDGYEIAYLLYKLKVVLEKHGSLNALFLKGYSEKDSSILNALQYFIRSISEISKGDCCSLMPDHLGGSAFKRLNLFLRWMVRKDSVDPGGWTGIPASKLLVPMDTHMFEISKTLKLTTRKQANLKTVLEVTGNFKKINTDDPVKYDFSLTRLGMHKLKDEFLQNIN